MNVVFEFRYLSARAVFCAILMVTSLVVSQSASGQAGRSNQHTDVPPGSLSRSVVIGNPTTYGGRVQPVRVIGPDGCQIGLYSGGGVSTGFGSDLTAGLAIGYAYRMKISQIPGYPDRELYPSVEVLDRLHPPVGMENEFPIQIVVTQNDLVQAIEGRMVTKVIYLEDPETALPFEQRLPGDEPAIDVGPGVDPLTVSGRLGRPMALIRIGSRVPTAEETIVGSFDFNAPPATGLSTPQSISDNSEFFNQFDGFENRLNDRTEPSSSTGAAVQPLLPLPVASAGVDSSDNRIRLSSETIPAKSPGALPGEIGSTATSGETPRTATGESPLHTRR